MLCNVDTPFSCSALQTRLMKKFLDLKIYRHKNILPNFLARLFYWHAESEVITQEVSGCSTMSLPDRVRTKYVRHITYSKKYNVSVSAGFSPIHLLFPRLAIPPTIYTDATFFPTGRKVRVQARVSADAIVQYYAQAPFSGA